ncbi:hypothetical protein C8B47_21870 [filamentous cyanobacterium CCP4]|nr:hypothetical protein C8B47_21870 [filamentous cyanobacterium CCP4]
MTWKIFGGESADLLIIALRQRLHLDEIALFPDNVATQFRLHLHRGIGYLSAEAGLESVKELINFSTKS